MAEDTNSDPGVNLDIWAIQNGEPVQVASQSHSYQGEAGDLATAFVETADGETYLRYTSESDSGESYNFIEEFYTIDNLETPVYKLHDRAIKSEDGSAELKYYINDEVTENEYLEKQKQLNYREEKWIESSMGSKSVSEELEPIIPNLLAVFESLKTDDLSAPNDILSIEEHAIMEKLMDVISLEELAINNEFVSREHVESGLSQEERIYLANAYYRIPGRQDISSEMESYYIYPKEAVDYYSETYFGYILDESKFPQILSWKYPGYKDGKYMYPVAGDGIDHTDSIVEVKEMKRLEGQHILMQYDQYTFEQEVYYAETENDDFNLYVGLPKSKWPAHFDSYMTHLGTKYALFKKNQYGYALLKRSDKEIIDTNVEEGLGRVLTMQEQEKENYLASLNNAYDLAETAYAGELNKTNLLAAHDAWDAELNKIYGMLREKLPADEMEWLKQEQRNWIKNRDELAGDPNEVGELAHWEVRFKMTMDQTLYLVDRYFDRE